MISWFIFANYLVDYFLNQSDISILKYHQSLNPEERNFDYYKKIYGSKKYINAENYAKSNISLPIHSKLNSTQIRYISNFLINITK